MQTTYQNGNRMIDVTEKDGRFYVEASVYDGTKWQSGHRKPYKTLKAATKSAEKSVAQISSGWTQFPQWTITNS